MSPRRVDFKDRDGPKRETASREESEAMEKLCELFDCEIGELFEYIPGKE
ncbi:MAG: helix-turn-helix domain-containing protein [Sedimenticola sp.]